MSDKQITVQGVENQQVVESLWKYISNIDVGIKWENEYLKEQSPSICVKQITTATKESQNIIGGYTASLPFAVYVRNKVSDTRGTLDITKPLNDLAMIFDEETKQGCPNIKLDNLFPLKIEMVSTPNDESGKENNEAIFMAMYKLTYKKQGGIL